MYKNIKSMEKLQTGEGKIKLNTVSAKEGRKAEKKITNATWGLY